MEQQLVRNGSSNGDYTEVLTGSTSLASSK
jgi:hypothetical protein